MKFFEELFLSSKEENFSFFGGMTEESYSIYLASLFQKTRRSVLVVTASLYEANQLVNHLSTYTKEVLLFPMDEFLTSEAIAISPDLKMSRLETLSKLISKTPKIVVTNLMGFLRFLPPFQQYKNSILTFQINEEISPKHLIKKLHQIGYEREVVVTNTGEMGERGFVVDIFPILEEHPIRFEFFGDTIESIRYFDEKTQKSLNTVSKITIFPFTEFLVSEELEEFPKQKNLKEYIEVESLYEYLQKPILIYQDKTLIETAYKNLQEEIWTYQRTKDLTFKGSYMHELESFSKYPASFYMKVDNYKENRQLYDFKVKTLPQFNEDIEAIEKALQKFLQEGKIVVIALKEYQLENFSKKIKLKTKKTTLSDLKQNQVNLICLEMQEGFCYKSYVFFTAKELFRFSPKKRTYKNRFKYTTKIQDLSKLSIGDYVVHEVNGIGIFKGLKTLKQNGMEKDYIEVEYLDHDKLYIPVEKIDLLDKYTGKEGIVPSLHK